ncbi:MAG: hypothetical protein K2W99_04355 [Chthoniobacterales bacterium]|nr:hypothetical protein [Chthoniobacterales bacterium]
MRILLFFLITFAAALFFITPSLFGEGEKTNTISRQEIQIITASGPQLDSPFVLEQEEAQEALTKAATNPIDRNPLLRSHHSFFGEVKKIYLSAIHFFKKTPIKKGPPPLQLILEPASFSVEETPELSVTFKITNNKKEPLLLTFPTNQRLEIFIKDPNGHLVTRWSQDREFDAFSGLVTINPQESVLFTEKMPTTGMHDGESYTLEVFLVGHLEYRLTELITPQKR